MNYFLDTEFHEYHKQQKVLGIKVGKPIPTIDLISIGIVSENIDKTLMKPYDVYSETVKTNREYYAISKDFDIKDAWNSSQLEDDYDVNGDLVKNIKLVYWLRENVLKSIFDELVAKENAAAIKQNHIIGYGGIIKDYKFTLKNFTKLINKYGKTNKQIAKEVLYFVSNGYFDNTGFDLETAKQYELIGKNKPKFYAYYADYDWVVFAQLFGKMMDLPNGFPMYCRDLKQILDETKYEITEDNIEQWGKDLKQHPNYPKQDNEHNALDDAKWNKKLHEYLTEEFL